MVGNRRKGLNKEIILDNATMLFCSKGYENTGIRDIAYICNCKPGNIYHYFNSKEDILFEVLMNEIENVIQKVRHLKDDNEEEPASQLRYFINSTLYTILSGPSPSTLGYMVARRLSQTHQESYNKARNEYEAVLYRILQRGIDIGCFDITDVRVVSYNIFGIIFITRFWYYPNGRLSIDQVVDYTWKFCLNAMNYKELASPDRHSKEKKVKVVEVYSVRG